MANNYQEHNIRAHSSEVMLKHNQTGNRTVPPTTTPMSCENVASHVTAQNINGAEKIPRTPDVVLHE